MKSLKDTARQAEWFYRNVTNQIRLMPDFLIIGTQKGGTTSLYNYLIEHPNIAAARRKEVHFFDQYFEKGVPWYRSHFPTKIQKFYTQDIHKQAFITGEGSPEYLFYPHIAEKVAELIPTVKLIAFLRNPVERTYSQYRHNLRWGHEKLSFEEAINLEEERTKEGRERAEKEINYHNFSFQRASYLARSIYVDQLQRWMALFPRKQILLMRSEDFYAEPAAIYKKVLMFLDVPAIEPGSLKKGYKQYNKTGESVAPSKMDPAIRKRLVTYFEPHNDRLYKFLGYDLGWDR